MSRDKFWAIRYEDGFYTGTWLRRVDAIAAHVHGKYRWTEAGHPGLDGQLYPMQREDWAKARKNGDRAVKVRLIECP